MPIISLVLAGLAGLLHVLFFVLESLRFSEPSVWRRFGASTQAEADAIRPMAFNQGFYNLFLAAITFTGIAYAIAARDTTIAQPAIAFPAGQGGALSPQAIADIADASRSGHTADALLWSSLLSMVGAALVLLISSRGKMARAAAIQGALPAAALLLAVVA